MAYIGNAPGSIRQGRRAVYEFTSTANQTAFSGVDDNGLTLDLLQASDNDVYLNGVRLIITDDYTISGDVLTLVSGAAAGDKLIVMTQDEIANDASYSKAASDSRYINYDGDIVNGTIQMGGSGNNITFADNNKAVFGTGNDLQIYHDSNNSYIDDAGDGSLFLRSGTTYIQNAAGTKTSIVTNAGAGQTLYHNNTPVFVTTATGIDVTGNINFGDNHWIVSDNDDNLVIESSSAEDIIIKAGSGVIEFRNAAVSGSPLQMKIDTDGNVGIGTDSPFTKFHTKDTSWSSGAPYGSVSLIEGNNVNDNNWGHLVITDTTTTNGHGGSIRFATGAANALNPFSGIQGTAEGASWGGIGFETRPQSGTAIRRMTIDSTGNVGIGTSTPSTKLEVAGTTKAEQYLLDAIAKDISDTAVDVFIYDTRKDSDGGAWRKRTQHTSWYNETLNTSTRGSRKEFPAVAVIVAETTQVTIYDGDDPDMPMWMVFNTGRTPVVTMLNWFTSGTASVSSVAQLNGRLCVGTDGGVTQFDFVEDAMYISYALSTAYTPINNRLSSRNDCDASSSGSSSEYFYFIVNSIVNDVAMTVLPNAPIDSATGLPVPTIAVATLAGVSVITDSGAVYDITNASSTYTASYHVSFDTKNNLWFHQGKTDLSYHGWVYVYSMPLSGDTAININSQVASGQNPIALFQRHTGAGGSIQFRTDGGDSLIANTATGNDNGIGVFYLNTGNQYASMAFQSTSDFNTGWQVGDIKLAALSDTDDTNVTGPSVLTNYNLSSGDLTGWTLTSADAGGGIYANQNPVYVATSLVGIGNTGSVRQNITVETGKKYIVGYKCDRRSSSQFRLGIYFGHIGGSIVFDDTVANGQTRLYPWTSDYTGTTLLQFRGRGGGDGEFTNFIFDEVEEDRSVNGNGLQVFGTVTKTAVATGADLVGYSGFSLSNYLRQPVNADLQGANNRTFMCWFKTSSTSGFQYMFSLGNESNSSYGLAIRETNGVMYTYDSVNSATDTTSVVTDGLWHHAVLVDNGSTKKLYLDGVLIDTFSISPYTVDTDEAYYVGLWAGTPGRNHYLQGSTALHRFSHTLPSPEQIAKIYNDEKVLFQENAKATLYGSSDAVTALAYDDDTELLHVGTSAGRSVFQGLRRIDNTTDAVGAAISASNGMVAED